jgi:hypothetical protein
MEGLLRTYSMIQEHARQQAEGDRLDSCTPPPGMLEVNVKEAKVDEALEEAISQVTEAAVRHQTGGLVTRVGPGSYIVRAHPAVSYGRTRQQYA